MSEPEHPYLAYLNLFSAGEELYNTIVAGFYSHAVKICKNLSNDNGEVISDVVARLAQEGNQNLLSCSYKLWHSGHRDIVIKYFPKSYESIFNDDAVIFIGKKFSLALKLSITTDEDGDRDAWGGAKDESNNRLAWQLLPTWNNNKVSFRLRNEDTNMFLKLGLWPDDINDRKAYGSANSETPANVWYLEPMTLNGEHYFRIVNKQFGQGLKLAEAADEIGDRRLWGHNGDVGWEPVRFAWEVKKFITKMPDELQ